MDEEMTTRPRPTWSPFEAIPVGLGAFAGTALAALVLPLLFDVRTSFVLIGLVFEALLAGLTLLWVRLRRGSPAALGLGGGHVGRRLVVGFLSGLALFAVTVFVVAPALYGLLGLLSGETVAPPRQEVLPERASTLHVYLGGVVVVLAAPIGEELFFRGLLFGGLRRSLPFWAAAVISAAIFAVVHVYLLLMPLLFLVGFGLAYIYERSDSLITSIAAHAAFNLAGYLLIVGELG